HDETDDSIAYFELRMHRPRPECRIALLIISRRTDRREWATFGASTVSPATHISRQSSSIPAAASRSAASTFRSASSSLMLLPPLCGIVDDIAQVGDRLANQCVLALACLA